MKSLIIFLWAVFIIISSLVLFVASSDIFISSLYFFIAVVCAFILVVLEKKVALFSPVFMLCSSFFINISFPALLFYTKNVDFSHSLLKETSFLYLVYVVSAFLPLIFFNKLKVDPGKNFFLKKEFREKNLIIYFIFSNLLIVLIPLFLLYKSGFTYLGALSNPLAFRFVVSAGVLAIFRKILIILLFINTFILSKYNFTANAFKSLRKKELYLFSFLHILLLVLFAAISGSRSVIFLPVFSSLIIYTFYRRINIKNLAAFIIIMIVLSFFTGFYSLYRVAANSSLSYEAVPVKIIFQRLNIFDEVVKRLDSYRNSLHFFEYIKEKNKTLIYFTDFHFAEQFVNHISQFIPRSVLENKGYYFSTETTATILNINPSEAKVTYNFGGISNAFWNFGLLGIMIEGFLLGLLVLLMQKNFSFFLSNDSAFIFYMLFIYYIPNSIVVDGFLNTMDSWNMALFLLVYVLVITFLISDYKVNFKINLIK